MKVLKKICLLSLSVCAISPAFAQDMRIISSFPIPGATRWDYIAVNPDNSNIYVSHSTQVEVLTPNGEKNGIIPNTDGVHGICFVPNLKEGFTSNGMKNSVTVFKTSNNEIIGEINAGQNPDFIMYDDYSKKVYVCNGRSNDLTIINPVSNKLINIVPLGGKPETAVSDGAGKLYINMEDKDEVVVFNTLTSAIEARWHLKKGTSPTGLAIDIRTKRLFIGCDKILEVMDATNGKNITTLPTGDGCDGVAFDPELKLIYSSNGEGTLTIIKETSADKYKVEQNLKTLKSARTLAVDLKTHLVYLPAADVAPAVEGQPKAKHPAMAEGSFKILVVGK